MIGTKGRNNFVEEFNCNCGGQGLICASLSGREKIKVIKMFVSLSNPILEVELVKEISP